MSRGPRPIAAFAVLALAALVLLLAEADWLRMLAAVGLVAGVAVGTFAVATPQFLAGDRDDPGADERW